MKSFNLGSDFRPGSQNWYHLHVPDSGPWHVTMEKDWDDPNKDGYSVDVPREEIQQHSMDGVPLAEAITKQLQEIGWKES